MKKQLYVLIFFVSGAMTFYGEGSSFYCECNNGRAVEVESSKVREQMEKEPQNFFVNLCCIACGGHGGWKFGQWSPQPPLFSPIIPMRRETPKIR